MIMSEKDTPPSDSELAEGKSGLEHVETKTAVSERKVVLVCAKCGAEQDFPVCEECGEPMDFEETKFSCASCEKDAPVPAHCGEPMAPKIK
jgi:hypothetical protein